MRAININAPVTSSKEIIINAQPEKVWQVMADVNRWSEWQTDIRQSKMDGKPAPNSTFSWQSKGVKINSTFHTVAPPHHLGWIGKTMGIHAIHNWSFTEMNGKTTVAVSESMEGILASIFKKSFNKNLAAGMQKWLDLLKETCEKS